MVHSVTPTACVLSSAPSFCFKYLRLAQERGITQSLVIGLAPFLLVHCAHRDRMPLAVFFHSAFEDASIEAGAHHCVVVRVCNQLRIHEIVRADVESVCLTKSERTNKAEWNLT